MRQQAARTHQNRIGRASQRDTERSAKTRKGQEKGEREPGEDIMALIPSQILRIAILMSYFSILCHYRTLDMPAHQTYGGSWKFLTFIDLVSVASPHLASPCLASARLGSVRLGSDLSPLEPASLASFSKARLLFFLAFATQQIRAELNQIICFLLKRFCFRQPNRGGFREEGCPPSTRRLLC